MWKKSAFSKNFRKLFFPAGTEQHHNATYTYSHSYISCFPLLRFDMIIFASDALYHGKKRSLYARKMKRRNFKNCIKEKRTHTHDIIFPSFLTFLLSVYFIEFFNNIFYNFSISRNLMTNGHYK